MTKLGVQSPQTTNPDEVAGDKMDSLGRCGDNRE